MEIAPGIHRITTPLGEGESARRCDLYLLAGQDRSILFDSGIDGTIPRYVLPYLAEHNLDPASVELVVASHCDVDHFGGLADSQQAFKRAQLVAHPADAGLIADFATYKAGRGNPFEAIYGLAELPATQEWQRAVTRSAPPNKLVLGGEQASLGGRTVEFQHLPGHTLGHLALWDAANAALILADAVLGAAVPTASGEPAFPPTYRHVVPYLETIARIQALRPDILATAHYGVYEGSAVVSFLAESQAFVLDLGWRLETALRAGGPGGTTLPELIAELNPRIGDWPKAQSATALAFPVVGHIEDLATKGRLLIDLAVQPAQLKWL
ncbi:MAG: MBL fold metallo-hydrolase [Bifidobacteriaceae bacterium]|jgi:glyoxylase-like metal-dependent hydrolase (beta-lactamase superfamily II)|nr:MBL fold metallo-hydrolase [Bifidobacteriaceae bacterium]